MTNWRHQKIAKWLAGCIRFWLGFILFSAGVTKLFGGNFIQIIGPPQLEETLAQYNLAFYAVFIAYCQIIIGFMLIVKRFATLGAVMAVPMFGNILMVVISQHWQGTPFVVGFFLICNIYLLCFDYHKIKFLMIDVYDTELQNLAFKRKNLGLDLAYTAGLVLVLLGVMLRNVIGQPWAVGMAWAGMLSFLLTFLLSKFWGKPQ